jgi:aerobic-type carbon monoxide dehydrogenase small subunit (CoxS/CutS family)
VTGEGRNSPDGARLLAHNGEVSTELKAARDGEFILRAQAFAQQAGNEPARMEFRVDGKPVKSCTVFAQDVVGASVRTIEGMANADGSLGVVQQAFQDHHGLQCGFCTPGMVMSAAALLADNPKPTESEVRHYLEGNICRCTGYHNIVKAVLAASGQDVAAVAAE